MAENDRNLALLYRIAEDNPELAKMLEDRAQDQEQYRNYQRALRVGARGLTLETAPDLRDRQEAALKYLQSINDAADDLASASTPKMSPIIEAIFGLYKGDISGRSGVNRAKVTELGDVLDDSLQERATAQDEIYEEPLSKFPDIQSEIRQIASLQQSDPDSLAEAIYAGMADTSTNAERAALLTFAADEAGLDANQLRELLITKGTSALDPSRRSELGRIFDEVDSDVQLNLQKIDRANNRVRAASNKLLEQYGGMTGAQRDFLNKIQNAVLGGDDSMLRQAVGLERLEGLPETEAAKQMRQIVNDMIKLPEGVDYWKSDVQHVADILASPAFMEAAKEFGYTGPPREVLERVTQNYEGEVGQLRKRDDIRDAYRIIDGGQPAGSAGRWLKALITRIFNPNEYAQVAREAGNPNFLPAPDSPEEIREAIEQGVQETEAEVEAGVVAPPEPEIPGQAPEEAAAPAPEAAVPEAAPEAAPEGVRRRPGDEGLPSEGTVRAMQRMADSQGRTLPIGQTGLFVQPGQEGRLFETAEGREGELVPFAPDAPGAEAAAGMPAEGEPRTGTDGVYNYTLDPDGTVRFMRRGREIRVTDSQPGAYYSILEKAFGEEIPERARPLVQRARDRLAGGTATATPAEDATLPEEILGSVAGMAEVPLPGSAAAAAAPGAPAEPTVLEPEEVRSSTGEPEIPEDILGSFTGGPPIEEPPPGESETELPPPPPEQSLRPNELPEPESSQDVPELPELPESDAAAEEEQFQRDFISGRSGQQARNEAIVRASGADDISLESALATSEPEETAPEVPELQTSEQPSDELQQSEPAGPGPEPGTSKQVPSSDENREARREVTGRTRRAARETADAASLERAAQEAVASTLTPSAAAAAVPGVGQAAVNTGPQTQRKKKQDEAAGAAQARNIQAVLQSAQNRMGGQSLGQP